MATTKKLILKKTFTPSLDDLLVSDARWQFWRQSRNARLWHAVLLTMNIEPSVKNRTLLKERFPVQYASYTEKLDILLRRSSTHKSLKPVSNPREGKTPSGKYVQLTGVLKFAKEYEWAGIAAFEAGLAPKKIKALDGSSVCIAEDATLDETDDLKNGLRLTYIRYAALVHLLNLAISKHDEFEGIRKQIFPSGTASDAALGRAIEKTVAQFAKNADCKVPYGYGSSANAREISLTRKVVKDTF